MRLKQAFLLLVLLSAFSPGCARHYFEIRGTVTDAAATKPVDGASVKLIAATRAYAGSTNAAGEFSIKYSVSLNQYGDLSGWLLEIEKRGYASQIIPMFQKVRLFGYYRRREVDIRLVKPPKNPAREAAPSAGKSNDPIAHPKAARRLHLLSRYIYLDSVLRRTESRAGKPALPEYINHRRDGRIETVVSDAQKLAFSAALALHLVADENDALRREAARVAWRWESPEIIHALIVALDDEDENVTYFASRTLERISEEKGNIIYRDDDEKVRKEKTAKWWEWYKRNNVTRIRCRETD
ncbi:MAG: HEAT repeat domain-containing protein [Planctomycetota bacterium]|jgi:hypothetical protein